MHVFVGAHREREMRGGEKPAKDLKWHEPTLFGFALERAIADQVSFIIKFRR